MTADAMVLIEGEYGVSPEFEWRQEHEAVIGKIADTNAVDSEWSVLRDVFKYKLSENVLQFIKDSEALPEPAPAPPPIPDPPFVPLSDSPDLVTTDGPLPPDAPPPPSPSPPYLVSPLVALDLQPSTPLGLVIAPFQPRPNLELNGAGMNGNGAVWDTGSGRALPAKLTTDEAKEELGRVFGYLHDFDEAPPFTVQRLAELAVNPRGHYKSAGKYIRALERTLLVTSTHKDYPLDTYALDIQNGAPSTIGQVGTPSVSSRASTPAPLDLARSPLFTPIPFLHRAAPNSNHRSLSRSPPPTSPRGPLPGDASGDANISGTGIVPDSSIPALGLVDELDDPRPGHLSDHPTALSSVTQLPEDIAGAVVGAPALGDRFVSAGSVEPEAQGEGVAGAESSSAAEAKAEDAEGYVRASTPEPSPTRVLAEETRERELAAAVAEKDKSAEGGGNSKETPAEGEKAEGTTNKEEKEESDRMVVDEPDEDKENVPS